MTFGQQTILVRQVSVMDAKDTSFYNHVLKIHGLYSVNIIHSNIVDKVG